MTAGHLRIPWNPPSSAVRRHAVGLLVLVFGLAVLLPTLTERPIELWDESTYANAAQNMRAHGRYLFTVDDAGKYATRGLSKPPLFLWSIIASINVFGQGLFALRFPSALATALTAFVAFWFAQRASPGSRGHAVAGVMAGLLVVLSNGAFAYGQIICIEPVLLFWVSLVLLAYAEAMSSEGRRAIGLATLAGVGIACAFLTKQLACAVAVFPLVLAELLLSFRRPKLALGRLTAAALPAIAIPGIWSVLAYRAVGDKLINLFFRMSIKQRVQGFGGRHHQRWLNRMEDLVDATWAPFPWELGLVALGLLLGVAVWPRRRERPAIVGALAPQPNRSAFFALPFLYALTWIGVYGNVAQTLLKWYSVGMIFPCALGLGFLLAAPALVGGAGLESRESAAWRLAAWLVSGAVVVVSASRFAEAHAPRLNVMLVAAVTAAIAVVVRGGLPDRLPWRVRPFLDACGVATLAILAVYLLVHPTLDPDSFHVFAREVERRGIRKVWVDRHIPPGRKPPVQAKSFFPPRTVMGGDPPWSARRKAGVEAIILKGALPLEVELGRGVEVVRAAGAYALFGKVEEAPNSSARFAKLLAKGPLTVESEHMTSEVLGTVVRDVDASGGYARAYGSWRTKPRAADWNFAGGDLTLPVGKYVAQFRVAFDCDAEFASPGRLAITTGKMKLGERKLSCRGKVAPSYRMETLRFRLQASRSVRIAVHGQVRHDKTEIWDQAVWNSRSKAKKKRPKRKTKQKGEEQTGNQGGS
jgi:4-amino-4-deoxy-L-arabinose transferase-like glycosyltransferase